MVTPPTTPHSIGPAAGYVGDSAGDFNALKITHDGNMFVYGNPVTMGASTQSTTNNGMTATLK